MKDKQYKKLLERCAKNSSSRKKQRNIDFQKKMASLFKYQPKEMNKDWAVGPTFKKSII